MATDPYGYESGEPTQAGPSDGAAPWLTAGWALGSAAFALVCCACGGYIGVEADEPTFADHFGVFLVASACAWPVAGVGLVSLALHLFARRWWAQAGPNLLLGTVLGVIVWFVLFCGTLLVASPPTGPL